MGRYYNGDIEGKFMFGVQCSTSGERFGAQEVASNWIDYEIDRDDFEILFRKNRFSFCADLLGQG